MRDQLRAGLQRTFSQRHPQPQTSDDYGDTDTGSDAYTPGQGPYGYETDSSVPEERQVSRPSRAFPEPRPPQAGALRDGASQEEMLQEMDSMFAAMEAGLGYTAAVLRRREAEMAGDEVGEGTSGPGTNVTSEEERELAGFT